MYGISKRSFTIFFSFKGIDEIIATRLRIWEPDKTRSLGNAKRRLAINVVFPNRMSKRLIQCVLVYELA